MNTIITSAERELRITGTLSDATCRSFTSEGEQARRGFEACLRFLDAP